MTSPVDVNAIQERAKALRQWQEMSRAPLLLAVADDVDVLLARLDALERENGVLAETLRPFVEFANRLDTLRGESPLWAVASECFAARDAVVALAAARGDTAAKPRFAGPTEIATANPAGDVEFREARGDTADRETARTEWGQRAAGRMEFVRETADKLRRRANADRETLGEDEMSPQDRPAPQGHPGSGPVVTSSGGGPISSSPSAAEEPA